MGETACRKIKVTGASCGAAPGGQMYAVRRCALHQRKESFPLFSPTGILRRYSHMYSGAQRRNPVF